MLISQRPTLAEEIKAENRSQFVIEAAGARIRLHPWQLASAHAAVVDPRRSGSPASASTSASTNSTTVPGVKEDVTDIILNLKGLVVSSEEDEPRHDVPAQAGPRCGQTRVISSRLPV